MTGLCQDYYIHSRWYILERSLISYRVAQKVDHDDEGPQYRAI